MYSNFYTKYTVLHILTKKKAKQPSLILCTGNKWGYTSSILHFVSQSEDTADWGSGFWLLLSLCFYLFNWKFLQQWTRTSIKNKERDRKKKESSIVSVFKGTLPPQKDLMQHTQFIQLPHIQKYRFLLHIASFVKESKMNKQKYPSSS